MYKLPAELTVHGASTLKSELLKYAKEIGDQDKTIYVDGSQVTDIDATGIQLLLSWYITMKSRGKELVIQELSETLEKMLDLSGALDYLSEGGNN